MIGIQCPTCTRRHATGAADGRTTCDAFPNGIPWEILRGEVDHRKAFTGDHGLRYDPVPGMDTSEMDASNTDYSPMMYPDPSGIEDEPLI